MSYTAHTVRSSLWSAIQSWGNRAISLVVYVVLARLLVPSEFGLVAYAMVYISFVEVLASQGLPASLIQRRDLTDDHISSALWISVAAGGAWSVVTLLAATPLSHLLGQPELDAVLKSLSVLSVVNTSAAIPLALLRRQLRFKALAFRSLVAGAVSGSAAILAAVQGYGAWSLVIFSLLNGIINALMLWVLVAWRPRLRVTSAALRDLWPFGIRMMATESVIYANRSSYDALTGWFLGVVSLGLYSVGSKLILILNQLVSSVFAQVIDSVLPKIQAEPERFRYAVCRTLGMVSLFGLPVHVGLAAVSDYFVPVVFGDKWLDAIPVLSLLAAGAAVQSLGSLSNSVLFSTGAVGWLLRLHIIRALIGVILFVVLMKYGIEGIAAGYLFTMVLMLPIDVGLLLRKSGLSLLDFVTAVKAPLISAVLMWVSVELLKPIVSRYIENDGGVLAVLIVAGVVVYLSLLSMLGLSQVRQVLELVTRTRR